MIFLCENIITLVKYVNFTAVDLYLLHSLFRVFDQSFLKIYETNL